MKNLIYPLWPLLACSLLFVGCDDTSAALKDRSDQEREQFQAEMANLRAEMKEAERRADERFEKLQKDLNEALVLAEKDTKDKAHDVKENVKETVDQADKAVAREIRSD